MKIVLDANVFISALLKEGGVTSQAIRKALREYTVLVPDQFIRDLYSFMEQAKKKGVKVDPVLLLRELALLEERGLLQVVPTRGSLTIASHEADNRYIEVAVIEKAQIILTGDQDLIPASLKSSRSSLFGKIQPCCIGEQYGIRK